MPETVLTPLKPNAVSTPWQQAMKLAIRDSEDLCKRLRLAPSTLQLSSEGEKQFPVFVPLEFLRRMRPEDANDPLLLQVLPRAQESQTSNAFVDDPVGDSMVQIAPGLLHKYHGRVLMILSGACAIHCRYCFRRHYPYSTAPKSLEQWQQAIDLIAGNPSIVEVILSGGDPLTITDDRLGKLVEKLDAIPHLKRLRIHTRLPVVIPQRVDESMCRWLAKSRLSKWVVLHINHRQEVDEAVALSVLRLKQAGAMVLNQAVLMQGINDTVEALTELSNELIQIGVLPYYLNQLDRVSGAMHFEVDQSVGLELLRQLAARLPGYAVPKYVLDIPGRPNKTSLSSMNSSP
jgi:L-lysine 2,3-aminomutase